MNFRQLIIRNLLGNFRTYAAYFISSSFAAMIFYIFSLLLFHPQLNEDLSSSSATILALSKMGLTTALVVIALLSVLFLWYTFVVFLKRRKRDLAIYLILGIEEKDLRRILFVENALLGTMATICGILLGILGTKLLLLIAQNVMHLTHGLSFMIPPLGVLLTFAVYVVLFLLISFIATRTLHGEQIVSLIKENEKPRPEPKSHWGLTLLGILLLLAGYGMVFYFSVQSTALASLLIGVVLTVAGTMLSFHQFSVFLLKRLKKRANFLQGTHLLTISEWLFRMRDNAAMYSLITLSTSVAFVGIAVMMAIGNTSFSSVQGISVAYFFSHTDQGASYIKGKADEVKAMIEAKGYQTTTGDVDFLSIYISPETPALADDPYYINNGFSVMKESDYQTLMAQINEEPEPINDQQILELSPNYSRRRELLSVPQSEREVTVPVEIGMEGTVKEEKTLVHSSSMLSLNYYGLAVVTDQTFTDWQSAMSPSGDTETYGFTWIDYPEWADDPELVSQINGRLDQAIADQEEEMNALSDALGEKVNDMTDEDWAEATLDIPPYFMYDSKFQVFQENRQGNGIILMITVLLGAVFFIFSASIVYFRLFADLDKDGAYHRSLHVLGVTPKERHQVIRRQIQVMYFLPTLIALIHFAVAMAALRVLVELPVWQFYSMIGGIYLIFQVCFYLICLWRYQKDIDQYADPAAL
ncbi:hypothetical protein A5886_001198 [Enterococcus sp. 8G7_MSG3316]|uniref:ABC3 transporter permease C-terminal domain-containing protein n=1 Tax=Candidatus Enterococcus testudinis TaxID=1834191 RepID=A0A242A5V8_9ENTE|nr:ABC transporter permease [Enterococcus sp. 8G7_MSG3316]OTN76121.1 hypothetical protein A5886_001198 [Enterococcus sp. 8G7_MSG3316]